MKIHYDPYVSEEDIGYEESYICGVKTTDELHTTGDWKYVTCGRCLKQKDKIQRILTQENKAIADQLGDMADFILNKEKEGKA